MLKQEIIVNAQQLKPASVKSITEYEKNSELLIALINAHLEAQPNLYSFIGQDNLSMMRDNHINHAKFMAAIMKNYNPQVFVETILWVLRAYKSHGFALEYWNIQLTGWITLLKDKLSEESCKEILPFYHWIFDHIMQLDQAAFEVNGTD